MGRAVARELGTMGLATRMTGYHGLGHRDILASPNCTVAIRTMYARQAGCCNLHGGQPRLMRRARVALRCPSLRQGRLWSFLMHARAYA